MKIRMKTLKRTVAVIFALFAIFLITSCATGYYHSLAIGSYVIATFDPVAYLDIHSMGRVSVGDELNVYPVIVVNQGQEVIPDTRRGQTGKVKITEIYDNGLAKATVVSGKLGKNDIVSSR